MISKEKIWDLMNQVMDPEVPVLSVVDLGIVRDVRMQGEKVEVMSRRLIQAVLPWTSSG